MRRVVAIALLTAGLAGCDAVDTAISGYKNAKAVESDLQQTLGLKPEVGFNWRNGRLQVVSVTFPRLYEGKSLHALAGEVRATVTKEFKETPDDVVLAFSVGRAAP